MKGYQIELEKNAILQKIRNNLWSKDGTSRASVLVGAGFSRNAKKLDDNLKSISLWSDLKKRMLEELEYEKYSDIEVTELADIYKDKYGVVELEKMLKYEIPDDNYEPGNIHQSLLELPFSDIFTTNYDTLLERTTSYVYNRNYQIIADPRDITGSSSPRIVKLHGSFPSNRPFVFSKKDYDVYQEKSGPFVNMVRQSIMETTMILVGFSGDDPNFKTWIKWIEESLGEHSPKIFMLNLNIKNMEDHSMIVPVDLAETFKNVDESQRYEVFFTELIRFLNKQPILKAKKWPHNSYNQMIKKKEFNKEIDIIESEELVKFLKSNREQYPGWLILPYKIHAKKDVDIIISDLKFRIKHIDSKEIKFLLLFELIWIYKTWRIPLFPDIVNEIEELVLKDDNPLDYYHKEKLITICTFLLREYRLDHNYEKFYSLLEKINHWQPNYNQKSEMKYQLYAYKFLNGDIENLSSLITKTYNKTDNFELKIKFSTLMLKIGEEKEAIIWMKSLLNDIRRIGLLDSNNIRAFSSEGILLSHLKRKDRANFKQYNDRLLDLENIYCSPTSDLEKFVLFKEPNNQLEYEYSTFDNRKTITTSISNNSRVYNNTNYLLSVRDDFYLGIAKDQTIKLFKYIYDLYPVYGLKLSLNFVTSDKRKLEEIFSRKFLLNLAENDIEMLYSYLKNIIKLEESNFSMKIVYDVFYRLYMVVEEDKRKEMELILHENYKNGKMLSQLVYQSSLIEKIYERILDYKFSENYVEFMEELLNYPLVNEPNTELNTELNNIKLHLNNFHDPTFIAYKYKTISYEADNIKVNPDLTDKLINYFGNDNKEQLMRVAFDRLVFINSINGLLPKQKDKFKKILSNYLLKDTIVLDDYNKLKFAEEFNLDGNVIKSIKNKYVYKDTPRSNSQGIISSSHALDIYIMNVSMLFRDDFLDKGEFNIIIENMYKWWKSQYKYYDINLESPLVNNREFEQVIVFLADYVFQNKNVNKNNITPLIKINSIFEELYEDDNHLYILLYPFTLLTNHQNGTDVLKKLDSYLSDFDQNSVKEMEDFNYTMSVVYNMILKDDLIDSKNMEIIVNKLVILLSSLTKSTFILVLEVIHVISKERYDLLNKKNIEYIISSFNNFYNKYIKTKLIDKFKWNEQYNILYFILEISQVFNKNNYDFKFDKWIIYMRGSEIPRLNAYSSSLSKKISLFN